MKNIKVSEQLQSELDELAEEGNKYFDNNEYDKALEIWKRALDLIPEPKKRISETVWFLTSIGDIYFLQGNMKKLLIILKMQGIICLEKESIILLYYLD